MLRKATEEDLSALVALRCKAAGTNRADAAGWLQNVAGLENILVLEKNGQPPAAMLAAVPVEYGQHHGIWLCGAAGAQGVPLDRLLPKLIESCLRAYGASGFDFAVMTSDGTQNAETLKALGFAGQLPLRLLQTPIRRDLLAQAVFDSLTVHKLVEMRHIYQPGCICLPEQAMNEIMTQLYRRGLTVVSNRRGGCAGKNRCAECPHPACGEPDPVSGSRTPVRLRHDRLFGQTVPDNRCVFQDAVVTAESKTINRKHKVRSIP